MATATRAGSFSGGELITAISGAIVVQGMMVVLLLAASASGKLKNKDEKPPEEMPMAVKPVADDLPLLKLGGAKPKLPDAWQKKAPLPVPAEPSEDGAPSPQAKDDPEQSSKKPLSRDAGPPPTEAGAAVADNSQNAPDSGPAGEVVGPGAANGSKNGTETDPLKARALDIYRQKLLAWFNVRFKPPQGSIPCDELKKLSAGVSASVGGDRSVGGFTITRPSGNDVFDAKVKSTMESLVGQELPPPPQNYPDLDVGSLITPVFSGASASCVTPGGDAPGQSKPPPGTEKPAEDKPAEPGGAGE
jgi:hypothetical protein